MSSRRFPRVPGARHQGGVGLIEVLVAVLIVSIGFLGVAALQVMSLSTNNSAMARSMATVASYSILDAMRVDRDHALGSTKSYNTTVKAGSCTAVGTTLASKQLHSWCTQLGHDLGAADTTTGKIVCEDSGDCTVTITFDDSRAGGDDAQQIITRASI